MRYSIVLLLGACCGCQGVGGSALPTDATALPTYSGMSDDVTYHTPVTSAAKPATGDRLSGDQPIVLHCDRTLPEEARLLEELTYEQQHLSECLKLPTPSTPLHVYLFAKQAAYRDHVSAKFPDFPARRAIFVQTAQQLAVYAHTGDHLYEDLRHEATHGYLHACVPRLPLWLDEGLAEYFEVGRKREGMNRVHVEYLRGQQSVAGWRPDLKLLETLTDAAALNQQQYAESWLWTHFLLNSPSDQSIVLTAYLNDLRSGAANEPLSVRLERRLPDAAAALVQHLATLEP